MISKHNDGSAQVHLKLLQKVLSSFALSLLLVAPTEDVFHMLTLLPARDHRLAVMIAQALGDNNNIREL